jgi:hypothetical protein|tara:strand:- start:333 stop:920 length:588 start_codon:yes stop_codon:yes gene_type:complete
MILDTLLTGVMLFSSFAMRDANIQPNPDDYEVSIGISHPNYFINRQWERELGTKYLDTHVWTKLDVNGLYFKPEYFDKESDNVKYLKVDWRKNWIGASWGFTTRSTNDELSLYETFASVGLVKKKNYGDKVEVEVTFDGYLPPDENGDNTTFEYEDKFKVSWKLTDKVRIYNTGEVSQIKGESNYKAKIGVEISL